MVEGTCCTPRAFRTSESTADILTKDVIIINTKGASPTIAMKDMINRGSKNTPPRETVSCITIPFLGIFASKRLAMTSVVGILRENKKIVKNLWSRDIAWEQNKKAPVWELFEKNSN